MTNQGRNNQLFIAIMSCKKNANLRNAIRRTWLRDCSYPYKFFIGGERSKDALDDEVYLDCPDTYEGLVFKTMKMINYVYKANFNFVFKCDDDSYVNCKLVPDNIENDYMGFVIEKLQGVESLFKKTSSNFHAEVAPKFIATYAAGMGYFLSRKSMNVLLENNTGGWAEQDWLEDKKIGELLYKNGIRVAKFEGGIIENIETLYWQMLDKKFIERVLVIHHCSSFDMKLIRLRAGIFMVIKYGLKSRVEGLASILLGQIKRPHIPVRIKRHLS